MSPTRFVRRRCCISVAALCFVAVCGARAKPVPASASQPEGGTTTNGLSDAVVLIIRHAEKPEIGRGLSPEGERRARNYVEFFKGYSIDGRPVSLDYLLAAGDSENSQRPRLTLEPLCNALGLKLDLRFTHQHCDLLAKALRAESHGKKILVCWRHGEMPQLLQALGAEAAKLLPDGTWPEQEFGWLIQLVFDHEGKPIPVKSLRRIL